MKLFEKKIVTVLIAPIVVLVVGTLIYDWVKGVPVFTLVVSVLKSLWSGLLWFFNLELKLWWLFAGIAVISVILYVVAKYEGSKPVKKDPIDSYTEANIKGIKWVWRWWKNNGLWDIKDIIAICPFDDTPLMTVYDGFSGYECECPRCGHMIKYSEVELQKIKMIIMDNARKGDFPLPQRR